MCGCWPLFLANCGAVNQLPEYSVRLPSPLLLMLYNKRKAAQHANKPFTTLLSQWTANLAPMVAVSGGPKICFDMPLALAF